MAQVWLCLWQQTLLMRRLSLDRILVVVIICVIHDDRIADASSRIHRD
jgi:hypothetical protein